MTKSEFFKLLDKAKEDEYGRFYILNDYGKKVYFGIMTTVCEDLFKMNYEYEEDRDTDELYDRHFWNDDTFEAHVISKHNLDTVFKNVMEMIKND